MTQRQEIIERLNGLEMEGGSHAMLSAICKAVLPHSDAWTLRRCADLRDRLVRLLGEADEEALREAYTKGREDGMGVANAKNAQAEYLRGKNDGYDEGWDAGFASADDWCAQHEYAMAEHGWYRVVDADKQTIRFNEDVEWELLGSGETESGYVVGIKIDLIAGRQSCRVKVVRDSDFQTIELMAKNLHHVKPAEPEPTVEDVLREMHAKLDEVTALYVGEAIDSDERDSDEARIFAEYAKRLRLAGDAE